MYVGFVLPCIALGTGKKIRNYLASVLVIFVDICTPQIENLSALWSTVLVNAAEERKGLETVFTTAVLRRGLQQARPARTHVLEAFPRGERRGRV